MHMHYAMSYAYTCIQEWPDSCVHCAKNNPSSFERRKGAATPTTNGYLILSIHTSYILHTLIIDTCAFDHEWILFPTQKKNEWILTKTRTLISLLRNWWCWHVLAAWQVISRLMFCHVKFHHAAESLAFDPTTNTDNDSLLFCHVYQTTKGGRLVLVGW